MKKARWQVTMLTSLLLQLPAIANDAGTVAYNKGDFGEAIATWEVEAAKGNPVAQFNIGHMYEFGEGVTPSHELAAKWYELAADQGDARAQQRLASLYYDQGKYDIAVMWYERGAEQGLAEAQADLGASYGLGQGVPQSYIHAHMWSNISSLNGFNKGLRLTTELAELMSAEEISIAQYLARECIAKSYQRCHTLLDSNVLLAIK